MNVAALHSADASPRAIRYAERVVNSLADDIPIPKESADEDGNVVLTWRPAGGRLAVRISPTGSVSWEAETDGGENLGGSMVVDDSFTRLGFLERLLRRMLGTLEGKTHRLDEAHARDTD